MEDEKTIEIPEGVLWKRLYKLEKRQEKRKKAGDDEAPEYWMAVGEKRIIEDILKEAEEDE